MHFSSISSSCIWVVRGGAIGDFVLTLPVLRSLQCAYPDAKLNIVANRQVAALACDAVKVSELRFLDDLEFAPFFSADGGAGSNLFHKLDLVISYLSDPDRIFEKNIRACGVKDFHVGPSKISDRSHAAEQLAQPLHTLGIPIGDFAPRLEIEQNARRKAQRKLGARATVAVHPGSGSRQKNWPIGNWIALISDLLKRDISIVVIGGEADHREIGQLRDRFHAERVLFAIDWPLRELAALLAECIFIGHDSGISHLAAASGARCLLLFGPTEPRIWAPRNAKARILIAPDGNLDRLLLGTVRGAIDQELIRIGMRT